MDLTLKTIGLKVKISTEAWTNDHSTPATIPSLFQGSERFFGEARRIGSTKKQKNIAHCIIERRRFGQSFETWSQNSIGNAGKLAVLWYVEVLIEIAYNEISLESAGPQIFECNYIARPSLDRSHVIRLSIELVEYCQIRRICFKPIKKPDVAIHFENVKG